MTPTDKPQGAIIEIIERTSGNDDPQDVIVPTEIRINGQKLLSPADAPVQVHGITLNDRQTVQVTLTLFAKRIVIAEEQA